MARTVTSTMENAIDNEVSYRFLMQATIEPSYIYFSGLDNNNPLTGSDPIGIVDDPVLQDISVSPTSGSLVTWWNDSATLKYMKQGDATQVSTTTTDVVGKPGSFGNYIYRANGTNVIRSTVDWSDVESESSSPFSGSSTLGAHGGTVVAVHGVSAENCVAILNDDGGLRCQVWDNTTSANQPGRFMSMSAVDYTATSGSERTALSIATHSGALQLDDKVFIYISNPQTGAVEGIFYDLTAKIWSDIFVAVSTDIESSMCEFRVANAYAHNGTAYLVGQFKRYENIGTDSTYSMVLPSSNGKSFSLDGFTLVSQLGYRFLATVGESRLFIGSCNRVSSQPITYVFDGTSGSDGLSLDIPTTDFISFREMNSKQNELKLRGGDDYYAYHQYVRTGSKLTLQIGYNTSAGDEFIDYATYIIESVRNSTAQGARNMMLNLISVSEWKLAGLSSPFYTEFFSKSSVYDELTDDSGNMYVASNIYEWKDYVVVDFWNCEPYENTDLGIYDTSLVWRGGVSNTITSSSHSHGFKTPDLDTIQDIAEYPTVTSGSVTAHVYGWSHGEGSGTNDDVKVLLFMVREDGTEEVIISEAGNWGNTYTPTSSGDYPIVLVLTDVSEGDKIKAIGLNMSASVGTDYCPHRVELVGGVSVKHSYTDGNTPWTASDTRVKLPKIGRPYIMFSQKPYDAWNFNLSGSFSNTYETGVSGYPIGVGLVGLALDGANYILGRYDWVADEFEIVKVVDSDETVLASVDASSYSIGDNIDLMFTHRNGVFAVSVYYGGEWTEALTYDWEAADGWMFGSTTVSRKTGIWGAAMSPTFRIVAFDPGGDLTYNNAECLGVYPGGSITDFPSSGKLKIDETVYSYTGKTSFSPIRGPSQLRQHSFYNAPYGDDAWGLESLDLDWDRSDSANIGAICALDNGGNYEISGSEYQVWIRTSGAVINLSNRSRQYSENTMIAKSLKSLANRVYVTAGFTDVSMYKGELKRHRHHTRCHYYLEGDMYCNWFRGSSGNANKTIADLTEEISLYSGAEATFPGDITSGSQAPGADTLYKVGDKEYAEGIDLYFTVDQMSTNEYVEVVLDATVNSGSTPTIMRITGEADYNYLIELISSGSTVDAFNYEYIDTAAIGELPVRVIFHENFVTFDLGEKWIYTFGVESLVYENDCDVQLRANYNATFRDIRLVDLSDWREAVYIDLETDGKTAISSVIQERPIDMRSNSDGGLAYWYDFVRDRITQVVEPRVHHRTQTFPRECASDAIVYYNDVGTIQNEDYASSFGFSTKVYRFPNLEVGAMKAAKIVMDRALESATRHELQLRPDMRLEVGDVLDVDFIASGTQKQIQVSVIVEGISLTYDANSGNSVMAVRGREEL